MLVAVAVSQPLEVPLQNYLVIVFGLVGIALGLNPTDKLLNVSANELTERFLS